MMMINEEYLLIVGQRFKNYFFGKGIYPNIGSPSSVQFSYDKVIEREEKFGDVIGFFHTHPSFYSNPSYTDDTTMDGWVTCLGRPLLCAIKGINGTHFYWYLPAQNTTQCIILQGIKIKNRLIGQCPNTQI